MTHEDVSVLVARGVQHAHAFIIDDILAAQTPPLQDLLLRSSILDRFCGPQLQALQDESAAVALARAWLLRLRSQPAELRDVLQLAEALLDEDPWRDEGSRRALRGCIASLWSFYWSIRWNGERMLESTTAALAQAPRRWVVARGEAAFMHATALVILGRDDHARRFFTACRDESAPDDRPYLARALTAKARMHFLKLRVRETLRTANEILAMTQGGRLTFATVAGRLFAGLASYERNALDDAREHFGRWELGVFGLAPAMYTDNAVGLALTLHALGDDGGADDVLASMTTVAEDAGNLGALRIVRSCRMRLALERGDDEEAEWQLRVLRANETVGYPAYLEAPEITLLWWLLRQGTEAALREADVLAKQIGQSAMLRGSLVSSVRAQSVRALMLQARGATEAALHEIVPLTRQSGAVHILVDFGPPMQRLISAVHPLEVHPCLRSQAAPSQHAGYFAPERNTRRRLRRDSLSLTPVRRP